MPNRHDEVEASGSLCSPAEAMGRLRVSRKTLLRWEEAGQLHPVRLPSGHRRYRLFEIEALERGDLPAEGVSA